MTTRPATIATPAPGMDVFGTPRPNDTRSFEELAASYNVLNTSNAKIMFTRVVIGECTRRRRPVCALDIGCGRGVGRVVEYAREIRKHVDDFWGIEPDPGVRPEDGLFDHFQHALMETAQLPENQFDVAYAYMVMEHVEDPEGFLRAVARCLKPGGSFIFATPNGRHYFTRIAGLAHTTHLDEAILRLIRGKERKEDYHYPVRYRFNHESQIGRATRALGLKPPEFVYIESEGPKGYMRGPLRPLFHALAWKRRVLKDRRALLTMIGRVTKPA